MSRSRAPGLRTLVVAPVTRFQEGSLRRRRPLLEQPAERRNKRCRLQVIRTYAHYPCRQQESVYKCVCMRAGRNQTPREIAARLRREGWEIRRKGPGDYVQFAHPQRPGRVTL